MVVDDQADVLSLLADPASYPDAPGAVERIDTHSASVFLAGDRAYKLKRAVVYDYLDFSTAERRMAACEAEVRLNRRTAPDMYLGTLPLTRAPEGRLRLGGDGAPIEKVVVMRRFREADVLDRRATAGTLGVELMPALADAVWHLHDEAAVSGDRGGHEALRWVIAGNLEALAQSGGVLRDEEVHDLAGASWAALADACELLDQRAHDGHVRQCHGDLHLRNVVLIGGQPTIFDCIEFNDSLARIDVLYDLAFLLMDLTSRGLVAAANALFNRYLQMSGEVRGLRTLPLFLSCRAAIRAKTSLAAAAMQQGEARTVLHARSRQYLALARQLLVPRASRLVAIGGRSGAGKSTLARLVAPGLGPRPGAVVVQSDAIRRRLRGRAGLEPLPADAYSEEATRDVYRALLDTARAVLSSGYAAVLDATFLDGRCREDARNVASRAGVRFTGLWLDAPADVLYARVAGRERDVSEATPDVVRAQLARDPGPLDWISVPAGGDASARIATDALMRDEV